MEVIFDTGSTYTYLPTDLHAHLVAAPCWKRPGGFKSLDDLKKEFKSVMFLKFQNGATMTIPPENYLVITVNT
nr:unnamed protein product [Digitaria exilis]